jgi:N6-L-threonylcarbamoyladenine synthase
MYTNAVKAYGDLPFLVCGGVASSQLLRTLLRQRFTGTMYFGRPELSGDNAVGVALIGADRMGTWKN